MAMHNLLRKPPALWLILVLAAVLWFGEYARRDLWEPDEARYGYVTQEMRDGGHWLLPYLNGEPYPDKPPFLFWLIHLSSLLFTRGVITSFSARMPSFLGAILTLWACTRLIAHWRNTAAAWRTLGILFTATLFWHEGSWGRFDSLLCGFTYMSIYCFVKAPQSRRRAAWEAAAYLWAALGTFLKGPAGLFVPMAAYALGAWGAGEAKQLRRWHWVWGIFIGLSLTAAWLLALWVQGAPDGFFASLFGEKSFGRALEGAGHSRPFYYYFLRSPVYFLPWLFFLPAAAIALPDRRLNRRFLVWIPGILLLFSCFTGKRAVYILTIYPAAAMWLGAAWGSLPRAPLRWIQVAMTLTLALLGILGAGFCIAAFLPLKIPTGWPFALFGAVLLAGTACLTWMAWHRQGLKTRWLFCCCTTLFIGQWVFATWVYPLQNPWKSPREAARIAAGYTTPGQPVYLYRQQLAIFPFLAGRPGREIKTPEELTALLAANPGAVIIMQERWWTPFQEEGGAQAALVHPFRVGSKKQILLHQLHFPPP